MDDIWTRQHATEFAHTLRNLREKSGLTQEGLAYASGLTKSAIQMLEAGRSTNRDENGPRPSNPRLSTVYALAHALNAKPAELLPTTPEHSAL